MSVNNNNQQPETQSEPSFKEKLDHQARVARNPNYGKEEPQPTLLEKGNHSSFLTSSSKPALP